MGRSAAFIFTVAMLWCAATPALAQSAAPSAAISSGYVDTFSPRVQQLLAQMTLDEKVSLNTGAREPVYAGQAGYTSGLPRLDIPSLRWADGARGINSIFDGTALPSSMALASTFSPELARRSGELLGEEARAMGIDVVLAPFVNFARLPGSSNALGEDPLLAARLTEEEVRGIQSTGALAMTQQFIGATQGLHRGGGLNAEHGWDFVFDDRTLHEIHLPAFEAAVRAGTASIMAAYNMQNGALNTENERTLVGVLRNELGFAGWINSDWNANRSVTSINKGLDFEMPGVGPIVIPSHPPQWGPKLKAAIEGGQVSEASLNRAVGRFLGQLERYGMLDRTRKPAPVAVDVLGDAAVARSLATQGAVLIKNDGTLPLNQKALQKLAFIGPTAGQLAAGAGGNRAYGFSDRLVSPLDAMKASVPTARIEYAVGGPLTGAAIPAEMLRPALGDGKGLSRDSGKGTPLVVEAIDYVTRQLPAAHNYVWKGTLQVPESGIYTLELAAWGAGVTLKVDGSLRASASRLAFGHGVPRRWSSLLPTTDNLDHGLWTASLETGKFYQIEVESIGQADRPAQVRFGWITPQMRKSSRAAAVLAAKSADTVVLFLWNGQGGDQNEGELGANLPFDQAGLVDEVVRANPNTVVVLNTGAGINMPWRGKVKSILQMWYPGQEGGWSTADLLLGMANPSGKLPMTFPLKVEDTAALSPAHPERYQGIAEKEQVIFSEGIFTGYRWHDKQSIAPMYPFGHGLSYTRFSYSDLKIIAADSGLEVSFVVRNSGSVAGSEVAQVYLGPPAKEPVPMAIRALVGFRRVELAPGEAKPITLRIEQRQLSYWSSDKSTWIRAGGRRPLYIGSSSRDLRLSGAAMIADNGRAESARRPGEIGIEELETGRVGR